MRGSSAARTKRCWPALVAAAVLLIAPPALASRTASTRTDLLASPALQPITATPALAPTYEPQGFALRLDADPHPATFALFDDLTPASGRLEPEKLASGVESWALTPNLQRLQIVVADSRWCREFLGPIDSPNLYQAFGLDPMNMTDPLGLAGGEIEYWACRVLARKQPATEGPKGVPRAEDVERTTELVAAAARGVDNSSAKVNRQIAEAVLDPFAYVSNRIVETVSGLWELRKTPVVPAVKRIWQRFSKATAEQRVEAAAEAVTDMVFAWATYQTGKALIGMVSLPSEPGMGPGFAEGSTPGPVTHADRLAGVGAVTYEGSFYRNVPSEGHPLFIPPTNLAASNRYTGPGLEGLYGSANLAAVAGEEATYGMNVAGRVRAQLDNVRIQGLLDLTDPAVRARLGVSLQDLVSNDYTVTQSVGLAAHSQGYSGILFPAARADGGVNIVVFNPTNIAVQP